MIYHNIRRVFLLLLILLDAVISSPCICKAMHHNDPPQWFTSSHEKNCLLAEFTSGTDC